MIKNGLKTAFLFGIVLLSGCFEREGLAPVVESRWRNTHSNAVQHVVVKGDTLYSIAFRYDQDYRQLANLNHLYSPYTLRIGQIIQIRAVARRWRRTPLRNVPVKSSSRYTPKASSYFRRPYKGQWSWPVKGRLVASFIPSQGKKGIDIAGHQGDKIRAASNGVVAYAGSGLTGYGNLIIIRHNNQYLTAYGNNARNLVVEGQAIKAGQVIAEMGVVDRRYWGVHFEIRQAGQPVNPLNYLPH